MHVQKQLFAERLSRASEELKEQDLPFKLEVINCANCRAHLLTCRDPTLCPGWTQQTLLWAGSLCITLALAVVAGDGTFSGTRSRQKSRDAAGCLSPRAEQGSLHCQEAPSPDPLRSKVTALGSEAGACAL
ncbi:PREDICTED: uncharacterized protein LOC102263139 isoform X10 [Myotis brandtii]|uniref:uncharacterized protein LOC102263139 isoform X10 n=1 Tax=Myotis brandtii TaxID=109478 RepID=UPI0007047A20|nr:PREDICTED: uncharacterized protein LOC102263139 isoform X10 [Myotis brandtii]